MSHFGKLGPLTRQEEAQIRYLKPENWTGRLGEAYREGEAEYARARAAAIADHRHDWFLTVACSRCGTTEIAHEAAKAHNPLGALCVPNLPPGAEVVGGSTTVGEGSR